MKKKKQTGLSSIFIKTLRDELVKDKKRVGHYIKVIPTLFWFLKFF